MTGDELKAHRLRAKLSRRALAERAGVHKDTVQYWEGKVLIDPRGWAPQRIAKALGLMIFRTSNARAGWGLRHIAINSSGTFALLVSKATAPETGNLRSQDPEGHAMPGQERAGPEALQIPRRHEHWAKDCRGQGADR